MFRGRPPIDTSSALGGSHEQAFDRNRKPRMKSTPGYQAWENNRYFPGHLWFPREMKSEERAQKFHTDDVNY